jgi:hypothetical protein
MGAAMVAIAPARNVLREIDLAIELSSLFARPVAGAIGCRCGDERSSWVQAASGGRYRGAAAPTPWTTGRCLPVPAHAKPPTASGAFPGGKSAGALPVTTQKNSWLRASGAWSGAPVVCFMGGFLTVPYCVLALHSRAQLRDEPAFAI